MTSYNVPATLAAAKKALGALGALLTATEWERAAIVYAFTVDGGRGGDRSKPRTHGLVPREFAAEGIAGLSSEATVRFYRSQWERAMKHGFPAAEAGKRVRLPDLDWRDHNDTERNRRYVAKDEAAIGRSLDREELDAEVLAQNMSDAVATAMVERIMEDRPKIARRVVAREQARDLPAAPFDTPPAVGGYDEYGRTSAAMDDRSALARLHNAVFAFGRHAQSLRPGTKRAKDLATRATQDYETLGAVVDALNGLTDDDLTALLQGGDA